LQFQHPAKILHYLTILSNQAIMCILFTPLSEDFLPDKTRCLLNFEFFNYLNRRNLILSARTVRYFGIREAIFKSCIGNMIGFKFDDVFNMIDKFRFADGFNSADQFKLKNNFQNNYDYKIDIKTPMIGSIIFETGLTESEMDDYLEKFILQLKESKEVTDFIGHQAIEQDSAVFITHLGKTISERIISTKDSQNDLDKLLYYYEKPLLSVFHNETSLLAEAQTLKWKNEIEKNSNFWGYSKKSVNIDIGDIEKKIIIPQSNLPKAVIVVFPGTNCEFDTARAFQKSGIRTEIIVVKTLTRSALKESIDDFAKSIEDCQILSIPGGFSMGDEPDGSGKFIAAFLKTEKVADSIERLLNKKGLIVGICNGFQALIKSGLLTRNVTFSDGVSKPSLTQKSTGRHVSRIVKIKVLPNR
ncbi:MAG TPA: phosphoribosylformylglycinamidine synthase subunit PurQ, partial [Exilispira sp.]|nr:phosphoribosylformylglycinamidine synthase subunit PurQ [Exilispira sp.]